VPKTARTTKRRRAIRGVGGRVFSRALKSIVLLRRFVDDDDALASFDASHLCVDGRGNRMRVSCGGGGCVYKERQIHGVASE